MSDERACRICGCVDDNCAGCIERTGEPCHWIAKDLCSACEFPDDGKDFRLPLPMLKEKFYQEVDLAAKHKQEISAAGCAYRELLMLRGVTS